jgi:hypothetical protein
VVTYNFDGQFKNAYLILLSRALVFAQKKQKQSLINFLLEQTDIYFENNHTLLAEMTESIQDSTFSKYDIGVLYLYLSYKIYKKTFSQEQINSFAQVVRLSFFAELL